LDEKISLLEERRVGAGRSRGFNGRGIVVKGRNAFRQQSLVSNAGKKIQSGNAGIKFYGPSVSHGFSYGYKPLKQKHETNFCNGICCLIVDGM
jgi:hypothetical protein